MQGIDIEMGEGGRSKNPMHEKKFEKGESAKAFGKAVKKEAARAAGKGLGGGVGVKQGVNTEVLGRLMEEGGGSLERLTIAINWVQNFGLIMLFDVAWPKVRWCCACGRDRSFAGGILTLGCVVAEFQEVVDVDQNAQPGLRCFRGDGGGRLNCARAFGAGVVGVGVRRGIILGEEVLRFLLDGRSKCKLQNWSFC